MNFKLPDDYLTGFGQIDMEHRRFIDILNGLNYSIVQEDHLKVRRAFFALVDYADYHFRHEEEIFEKEDFPALAKHKKAHRIFKETLTDILQKMKNGEDPIDNLAEFLRDGLLNHIKKMDMEFRDFMELMRSRERKG